MVKKKSVHRNELRHLPFPKMIGWKDQALGGGRVPQVGGNKALGATGLIAKKKTKEDSEQQAEISFLEARRSL